MKTSLLRKLILTFSMTGLTAMGAHAQVTNSNYIGMDMGNWGTADNWSPPTVPNNSGIMSYNVSITDHAVNLDIDPTISILQLGGDAASITSIDHSLSANATSVTPAGTLEFTAETTNVLMDAGALSDFAGSTLTGGTYRLTSAPGKTAILRFDGADIRTNSAVIFLTEAGSRIVNQSNADALTHLGHNTVEGDLELTNQAISTSSSLINEGYIFCDGSTFTINGDLTDIGDRRDPGTVGFLDGLAHEGQDVRYTVTGVLTNYDSATHTLNKGRYLFSAAGGRQNTLQVLGGELLDIVTNNAAVVMYGPNTGLRDKNGNNALRNLAVVNRDLEVGNRSFTTVGNLTINDSLVIFGGSDFTVNGNLIGNKQMIFSVFNAYTFFTGVPGVPTDDPALGTALKVQGNFTLGSANNLALEVFGPSAQGRATVTGAATLNGTLSLSVLDGATVSNSDILTVLSAATLSGSFSNAPSGRRFAAQKNSDGTPAGSFRVTYSGHELVLSDYLPHAGLLNLSSRARVQTGDNVTIGGFIVAGIDAKQILVRGLGASLASKGVSGALADPALEIFDGTGASVMSNNDWKDSQQSEIQATGLAPADSHESAILATLAPGSYTAVMRGVANTSGVGLVEVYDLDQQPALGELVNISTRGRVATGDDVLIGGIIIQAGETAHLIVRAIGASLASQQVSDPLADPTLDLYNSSGTKLMSNDNWNDDPIQSAQIQKEGLAPTDVHESALLGTLTPGNYTAIIRGKNNTQGVALVEFYKLN